MTTVGVRKLKNHLNEYLRRASEGEHLVVTDRGRPLAVISPPPRGPLDDKLEEMIREGIVRWGGGKPRGSAHPVKIKGPAIAETVIEDRR